MIEESRTKSLKDRSYYSDLYDRGTVERCRITERSSEKVDTPPRSEDGTEFTQEELIHLKQSVLNYLLYFETGERYLQKEDIINEWMARDRAKDELYERAQPPANVRCLTCGSVMDPTWKDLHSQGDKERMLFMYDCPSGHLPRRSFFSDGEEWKRRPRPHCPKCSAELKEEDKDTEEKFITISTCGSCGYTNTDEIERTYRKDQKPDPDYAKDRERFCLSSKKGEEYREGKANLEELKKFVDEFKEREKDKELYDAVEKVRKLTVAELEKVLRPVIEKAEYVKFDLGKPNIQREMTIEFSAQDGKTGRGEYDSVHDLQKLIKTNLEDANWRLMSEGITYRLGFLNGRLRAYEKEDDLVELMRLRLKRESKRSEKSEPIESQQRQSWE